MKKIDEMNIIDIYFELIFIKQYQNDEYNLDDIYKRAKQLYRNENKDETITDEEVETWIHNNCCYEVLTGLLYIMIRKLNSSELYEDKFMFYNFPIIMDIMHDFLESCDVDKQYDVKNLTKLTEDEIDKCICEILKKIDPSFEWLKIYETAKKDGKILYLNKFSKEQLENLRIKLKVKKIPTGDSCIILNDGTCYLDLTYNNTLQDVINTIHELIHYIIKTNKIEIPQILSEFFSIFYEIYTIYYLKDQEFNINELLTIYQKIRIVDLSLISLLFNPLYNYLKILTNNKKITLNDDLSYYEELLKSLKTTDKLPDKYKKMQPIDLAYKRCDEYTKFLLDGKFYDIYPYIVGSYLAFEAIQNFDDEMLNKIRSLINASGTIDPYDVFVTVGCDVENLKLVRVGEGEKQFQKEKRP